MRKSTIPPPIPMPSRVRSLIGARFGRLFVRYYAGADKHRRSYWCCECDCGNYCRVSGMRLLGREKHGKQVSCGCARADPGIRRAARMTMDPKRRAKICKEMRKAVRRHTPAYSMDAHRAAELLGVTMERIRVLVADGHLRSTTKRNALWVSSEDVSSLLKIAERKTTRCPLRAMMKRG